MKNIRFKGRDKRLRARADKVHELRQQGMSWPSAGKTLNVDPSALRRSYWRFYPGERPIKAVKKEPKVYVRITLAEYEKLKRGYDEYQRLINLDAGLFINYFRGKADV